MNNTSTTTIRYIVQASLNGGKFYDASEYKTASKAESQYRDIIKRGFPTWRGMREKWRIVRRVETRTIEERIHQSPSVPVGKKRLLLAEMFIPQWLPKRLQNKFRMLPIPGAKPHQQPGCQQPPR